VGREKSLLRRHPWIFSGAVAKVSGDPQNGGTVKVLSADGAFLAKAAYSPNSQIRARVWAWDEQVAIGVDFFKQRLANAITRRRNFVPPEKLCARRLVHGESDGLPGLIIDQYQDWIVVQFLSSGADCWRDEITAALGELLHPEGIYERSDVDVRRLEGLAERSGQLWGNEPPEKVEIRENDLRFLVDLRRGHKTGFYLDQRFNRQNVCALSRGAEVLDCFCYTGGFSVAAMAGEARAVTGIDTSPEALQMAEENLILNNLPLERYSQVEGDVFHVLRGLRDRRRQYDLVILDPPKFAPTAAQSEKAARGYKDINLLAFKLLRPGGLLVTFSCSGGVDNKLFKSIVAGAALDAGVEAQVIEQLHQSADHPVALSFPEGEYLKGLIIRVL
jgi:23S rRNA (cytosine1962-C5)-methyltransferase